MQCPNIGSSTWAELNLIMPELTIEHKKVFPVEVIHQARSFSKTLPRGAPPDDCPSANSNLYIYLKILKGLPSQSLIWLIIRLII